jgi:hypothetical protein
MSEANPSSMRAAAGTRLLRIPICGLFLVSGAVAAVEDAALAQCAAITDAAARLACYDTLAGRPADAAPAPLPSPPAATADAFGKPAPAPPEESLRLDARVVGSLKSWKRGTVIRLDNGQVWKSIGDESAYYPNVEDNAAVTITRSFIGTYWMEVRSIGRKIKVRRIS